MKKFEGNSNAYGKIIEKYRKNKTRELSYL